MQVNFRRLGLRPYEPTLAAMKHFTDSRDGSTTDEIWALEHPPVYTLGLAGKMEHVHDPDGIAVIKSDRGGQVTYHGPGQLVVYALLDLRRLEIPPRALVQRFEQAIIDLLDELGLEGIRRAGAPGVYLGDSKIAALGLRIRRGCSYHGLAVNVNMDLDPFQRIDPCGYRGLQVTQLADHGLPLECQEVATLLHPHLLANLDCGAPELGYSRSEVHATPAYRQEAINGG